MKEISTSKYQEKILMKLIKLYSNLSAQISIIMLCVTVQGQLERRMGELMSYWELAEGLYKRLCVSFNP